MAFNMLSMRSGFGCHGILPMLSKNLSLQLKDMPRVALLTRNYHSVSHSPIGLCTVHHPLILRVCNKSDATTKIKEAFKTKDGKQVKAVDRIPTENSPLVNILHEKEKPFNELTTGEKVVRVGSDAGYTMVVIFGVGLIAAIGGALFYNLVSSQSHTKICNRAFELVKANGEIAVLLGSPIKAYGEVSGRGRRNHMSHIEYMKDGVKHMRMKFYVQGPAVMGTVQLEAQKVEGNYEFRYIFVTVHGRTIIIEDNRASMDTPLPSYDDDLSNTATA